MCTPPRISVFHTATGFGIGVTPSPCNAREQIPLESELVLFSRSSSLDTILTSEILRSVTDVCEAWWLTDRLARQQRQTAVRKTRCATRARNSTGNAFRMRVLNSSPFDLQRDAAEVASPRAHVRQAVLAARGRTRRGTEAKRELPGSCAQSRRTQVTWTIVVYWVVLILEALNRNPLLCHNSQCSVLVVSVLSVLRAVSPNEFFRRRSKEVHIRVFVQRIAVSVWLSTPANRRHCRVAISVRSGPRVGPRQSNRFGVINDDVTVRVSEVRVDGLVNRVRRCFGPEPLGSSDGVPETRSSRLRRCRTHCAGHQKVLVLILISECFRNLAASGACSRKRGRPSAFGIRAGCNERDQTITDRLH